MQKGIDFIGISVVTVCHDGRGKYLLEYRGDQCRDEHFTWSPAGSGGVRKGESLEDAVRREILEECGAQATHIEPLGFREVLRTVNGNDTHWIAFDFRAQISPGHVVIHEPEKCLKLEWFLPNEFPAPLHSQFPFFLEKYKDVL